MERCELCHLEAKHTEQGLCGRCFYAVYGEQARCEHCGHVSEEPVCTLCQARLDAEDEVPPAATLFDRDVLARLSFIRHLVETAPASICG